MSKKYKKILLTGGSGNLGRAIIKSGLFEGLIAPTHPEMDITDPEAVGDFFQREKPDAVIHAAAVVKMLEAEKDPTKWMETNIVGTCNVVREVIKAEKEHNQQIRFIHISTDGVYPGTRGNYFERDITIPYNFYGWSKLGAETAVNLLKNFCIIRTSFFDPENIKFDTAATDKYSSRVPIRYVPRAIKFLLESDFTGTVNVGGKNQSEYETYKKYKPEITAVTYADITRGLPVKLARNATLNSSLWNQLKKGNKDLEPTD